MIEEFDAAGSACCKSIHVPFVNKWLGKHMQWNGSLRCLAVRGRAKVHADYAEARVLGTGAGEAGLRYAAAVMAE